MEKNIIDTIKNSELTGLMHIEKEKPLLITPFSVAFTNLEASFWQRLRFLLFNRIKFNDFGLIIIYGGVAGVLTEKKEEKVKEQ